MEIRKLAGVDYTIPSVSLLNTTPLWVAEVAGRTAYDSFSMSEHSQIQNFKNGDIPQKDIESSALLSSLAWIHFHHSVLEMVNITFSIKGTSRSVLVEHTRHRIQSLTVQSTRYTMSSILNAFTSFHKSEFIDYILSLDMFVVTGEPAKLEAKQLYDKLELQHKILGFNFTELAIAKSSLPILLKPDLTDTELFNKLQAGKKKRNVGDAFKWVVTDNWKVDMVVTFNLRSLKNYFQLRDSGAAYFQIQWLAQAMKEVTPQKYLDLIVKNSKGQ